jgi:hypothetical protein
MLKRFVPALAGLLLSGLLIVDVQAADESGNFALRGFGAQTCSAAVETLNNDPQAAAPAVAWMLGYSTAFNRIQSGTFDVSPLADATSFFRLVINICGRTPDTLVETVAFDVLRTLAAARVTKSSPMVETKSGEAVAQVRQATLLLMQQRLVELGLLNGQPDGAYGGRTEAALKAFQQAQSLPVTGVADAPTIVRLLVELPAQQQQQNQN